MRFMIIGLLVVWAIACLGGSIYGACLGVVLHKEGKKMASALLFCLSIVFIALSFLSLRAI